MTRQPFGGSEPLDLEAIRQSPRQFVDLETVEKLSDYAMVCELKIEWLKRENETLQKDAERYRFLRKFLTSKDMPILTGRGERDAPSERDDVDFIVDATMKGQ